MPETAPKSGAELLARIRPVFREESTEICLRPDLLDEWEEASSALNESKVEDLAGGRLAGGVSSKTRKLAVRVQEIETAIEAASIMFRFRACSKDRWQEIVDDHPPRPKNDLDMYAGYNRDLVLDTAVRECLVDPVFEDCDKAGCEHTDCGSWEQLVASCNPSEWVELRNTVNSVNRSVVDAPKSVLASQILSKDASVSRPRKRGE